MSDFRNNELVQLTLCRVREFLREPEAIFWTLVFPVVMALGLGIAFRNKGPDKVFIGVVQGGGAQHMVDALRRAPDVEVRLVSQQEADDALEPVVGPWLDRLAIHNVHDGRVGQFMAVVQVNH